MCKSMYNIAYNVPNTLISAQRLAGKMHTHAQVFEVNKYLCVNMQCKHNPAYMKYNAHKIQIYPHPRSMHMMLGC